MQKQPGYYDEDDCDLDEFKAITSRQVDPTEIPHAEGAPKSVPVYDMERVGDMLLDNTTRRALLAEWAEVFHRGAGVVVLRKAVTDLDAIDAATSIFEQIILDEKGGAGGGADHFAAAGSNDRIWNALQKLCVANPAVYARYHASPAMDAVCEAWLGPNYQITAQVNVVHPGGQAQQAHRDYHLGFQTAEISATYPSHVHDLSPLLTLQGGLAHCDVSIESGPTKLLPFSQTYRPGYAAWRREDFRAYFEENYVQLPLEKGDCLFFNPALFHAAGSNSTSDVHRMVNLFQISSAFGRAMETLDRSGMCLAVYPVLEDALRKEQMTLVELDAVLNATAEGYSFPTNLDNDPPVGGLAPETMKALMRRMLLSKAPLSEFAQKLEAQNTAKLA